MRPLGDVPGRQRLGSGPDRPVAYDAGCHDRGEPAAVDRGTRRRAADVPALRCVQGPVTGGRHPPLRPRRAGRRRLLGASGRRPRRVEPGVAHDPRLAAAVLEVVRRWAAQRVGQLPRPPRRGGQGRQGRDPLGGRARRHAHDHLRRPAERGLQVRERPDGPRRAQGRRRQHLPADDPRGRGGDARLRPHRSAPQRRVRRVLVARARRPHQRRRGQGAHHRRRRLPPRRGVPPQAGRRRGGREHDHDRARRRRQARRQRGRDGRRPRPLVPRPDGRRLQRLPAGAARQRGPALPPLHQRHHRQAEGHHAHDGWLPHPRHVHPPVRLRPAPRHRRVLVHRRRRLDHRPQLHRLRAALERRHPGDVRGRARTTRATTASGTSSSATGSRSSTRHPRPSGPS